MDNIASRDFTTASESWKDTLMIKHSNTETNYKCLKDLEKLIILSMFWQMKRQKFNYGEAKHTAWPFKKHSSLTISRDLGKNKANKHRWY